MGESIQGLRKGVRQIQSLLSRGGLFTLAAENRLALQEEAERLLDRLDSLEESYLLVGLLGGTGVGKSSIMNALAGAEISQASHRRPNTRQVVIYRHRDVQVPASLHHAAASWREIPHEAEAVRQVLLCDLPDFDSLVGEHRERALEFLSYLDMVIWVASPEKYADERFYALLRQAPKAERNYFFVLNKVDLFFEGQSSEKGYASLSRVMSQFQKHLSDNGMTSPVVYALSAAQISRSGSASQWNQFPLFREQLFQLREAKEVVSIKSSNLDVEMQRILTTLEREMLNLKVLSRAIEGGLSEWERKRAEWAESGRQAISGWLNGEYRAEILARLDEPSALVGPGYTIALLLREWRRLPWRSAGDPVASERSLHIGAGLSMLARQLDEMEHHLVHSLLYHGIPGPPLESLKLLVDGERRGAELARRLHGAVETGLAAKRSGGGKGFRLIQYTGYATLLLLFLFGVAGQAIWQGSGEGPVWPGFLAVGYTVVRTIFGPSGLAALASLILLQALLGLRFYSRYKKSLQRRTQKFIEALKIELGRLWEEEFDSIVTQLNQYLQELETQISTISQLKELRKD